MREIIIRYPVINKDETRAYSWELGRLGSLLPATLDVNHITPDTHPRAVDLCAGDGSWARILAQNGWTESNIVCIDRHKTTTPLVPGAQWRYWDLEELGHAIRYEEDLPPEILAFKKKFDIAILIHGYLSSAYQEDAICEFLVRPKGLIINMDAVVGRLV